MVAATRLTVVLMIASTVGCGSKEIPATGSVSTATNSVASSESGVSESAQAAPVRVTLPVTVASTPHQVVIAFLNAMKDGDSGIAAELLTEQARSETTKHQWPVQPPGAPSATYKIGEARFVDAQQTGVHIPCLWSEPDGSGGTIEFEVTWALRHEAIGWRVAGFATEIVPGKDPYYFNFEDIAGLRATQAAAEAALLAAASAEEPAAEVAEQPTQPLR